MDRYRKKLDTWLREIFENAPIQDNSDANILDSSSDSIISNRPGGNVYFQPPPSLQLKYPCVIYRLSSEDVAYASNIRYKRHKVYEVIVVDRNPDTDLPDKVAELPYCSFSRSYQADGLNHYAYTIHI